MFLSDASVKRPIAMGCLIIGLALLGFNAYRLMGLELMPKVDMPFITVTTIYPGASAEEIETDIAKRIEDKVVAIDGLKHVTSSCMENVCQTLLEFNLDVDVDIAATDVREKIDLIMDDFPVDVEDPIILKYDVNAKPIITLALTGDLPLDELYDYADNTLRDRISVLSGVADVTLVGGAEREVQILLDRDGLASRGLTSLQVVEAVQSGIRTIPSGRLRSRGMEYSVKFKAEYDDFKDIMNLPVVTQGGRRCYIRDLAEVVMGTEELRQWSDLDGCASVAIKVVKKSDANAVAVVKLVRAAVARLENELPGGMKLVWVTDDGTFTEATNISAWINIFQGVLLTAGILFIFLYSFRALLVVALTMPLTIVIGLFFMHALGITLNMPTLIAIGMSVGILVTNSIVVLEATVKQLGKTGNPKEAARKGAAETFLAVLASAGTNMVVLFPMSAMTSMVGMFTKAFSMTLLIMTVVSFFISFTLTPLLCSLLLKAPAPGRKKRLQRMEDGWNRGFDQLKEGYGKVLGFFAKRRWAAIIFVAGTIGLVILSLQTAERMGTSLGEDPDKGEIYVKLEFPTDYSLALSRERLVPIVEELRSIPEVKHVLTTIGKVDGSEGQTSEGVYLAQVLLCLSQKTERDITIAELSDLIRHRLKDTPDTIVTVAVASLLGGQRSQVEMEIAGQDLNTLDKLALKTESLARAIPGIIDLDTTVRPGKPELRITPNRAVLSDLGIPAIALGISLRGNLEGIEAATFKKDARNYDIVVKFKEEDGKDQVSDFLFPGTPGRPVTLETLADLEERSSPIQIIRKDKQRISKLFTELKPELPLGKATSSIGVLVDESDLLPSGYSYRFGGIFEFMTEGQAELAEAGLISLILIILVLSAILESFRQPILILATIPVTLIGMIGALYLGGFSLSVFILMGGVMLIGIVVNNAILIMDQFNFRVSKGIPRHKAMIMASKERLRPIIMITIAAVLGMLPLAFGRGLGAELRHGIGLASAGGLLVSGIFTIFLIPILYDLFTRRGKKMRGLHNISQESEPAGRGSENPSITPRINGGGE